MLMGHELVRIERLAVGEARPLDDDAQRRVRRRGLDVKPTHVRLALDPIAVVAPEPDRAAPRGGEARLDGAVQRGVHGRQHTMTECGHGGFGKSILAASCFSRVFLASTTCAGSRDSMKRWP